MPLRRFYVIPLRAGVSKSTASAVARHLAVADQYIPSLFHSAAGVSSAGGTSTLIWECCFEDREAWSTYASARYHATVIDRYLLQDSPARVARTDFFPCGYHCEDPGYFLPSGIRRLLLLRLGTSVDTSRLNELAKAEGLRGSIFTENTHQARDRWWCPYYWTHLWEQGFASRGAMEAFLNGPSQLRKLELSDWRGAGLDVESFEIHSYPVRTGPRRVCAPPGDHSGERLLQIMTAVVRPDDLKAYLDALRECYDPAAHAAGMSLESRWVTSAELGEDVTVQSTWSIADDEAIGAVRARLVQDRRWHDYVSRSEELVQRGERQMAYPLKGFTS